MNSWFYEVAVAVGFIILAALLNLLFGHFVYFLLIFLACTLLYQRYQVKRLESWLRSRGVGKQPKSHGIWNNIYYHIYRVRKSEKRRKKRLGEMLKQFRSSTAALPDAAVVLGRNDEIEWSNKVARQNLGLKKNDKGQRLPNLIRNPQFAAYLKKHTEDTSLIMPAPADANKMLEFRVIEYGAGLRLLLAHDVTTVKKMERIRKDFVANISHELRTPLTVLKGYLETLLEFDEENNALMSQSLQQMQGQTERMEHLVDDLLLLTRLETQQKQSMPVDVCHMLTEICQESNNLKEAQGRIVLSLDSDIGLQGDKRELHSAFSNLVINALKYSADDSPVKVHWYASKYLLRLDVIDLGEGIAAQDIPRVTERFYRVDIKRSRQLRGTGLGLAIVKHVLARHDAVLEIHSSVGKGSCFSCIFKRS